MILPSVVEPEVSLLCSQAPANGNDAVLNGSSTYPHILFEINFNIILPTALYFITIRFPSVIYNFLAIWLCPILQNVVCVSVHFDLCYHLNLICDVFP